MIQLQSLVFNMDISRQLNKYQSESSLTCCTSDISHQCWMEKPKP